MKAPSIKQYPSVLIAVASAFLLTSCAITTFKQVSPKTAVLRPGDKCLLVNLPGQDHAMYTRTLASMLEKKRVEFKYLPAQEWELRAAGILNPLDSSKFEKLRDLGYTHLLAISELSNRSENSFAYYTPAEVQMVEIAEVYNPRSTQNGNESEILLQLVPISDINATYALTAKTNITHMTIRGKDQSETFLNPTSVETARFNAAKKAAKKMLRDLYGSLALQLD
jgi:hypothetical protein